jgi:hypothetical protein
VQKPSEMEESEMRRDFIIGESMIRRVISFFSKFIKIELRPFVGLVEILFGSPGSYRSV